MSYCYNQTLDEIWLIDFSPGHLRIQQLFVLVVPPVQFAPPCLGSGFVQDLVLVFIPVPQEREHNDQLLNFVQPPCTRDKNIIIQTMSLLVDHKNCIEN